MLPPFKCLTLTFQVSIHLGVFQSIQNSNLLGSFGVMHLAFVSSFKGTDLTYARLMKLVPGWKSPFGKLEGYYFSEHRKFLIEKDAFKVRDPLNPMSKFQNAIQRTGSCMSVHNRRIHI